MKKTVFFVALAISASLTSCNKKVDASTQEQMPIEETTTEVVDTTQTDTVAPVDTAIDSTSTK